jgi:hypothetical protein
MTQDTEQQQQQQLQKPSTLPHFDWPTSKPGPYATQPPPGQKTMPGRTEQVVEIGYNQETGEPGDSSPLRSMPDASLAGKTSFDRQEIAPRFMKKRKKK